MLTHIPARTAVVTLSKALYERVLRDLLVDRAEHAVELYEGSGSSWTCARCVAPRALDGSRAVHMHERLVETCSVSFSRMCDAQEYNCIAWPPITLRSVRV